MLFTYVLAITGGTIKKLKLNISRVEGHRTVKKLQWAERK